MIDCMPDKMREAQRKTFLLQHYYDIVEHIIKENPQTFVPDIDVKLLGHKDAIAKAEAFIKQVQPHHVKNIEATVNKEVQTALNAMNPTILASLNEKDKK